MSHRPSKKLSFTNIYKYLYIFVYGAVGWLWLCWIWLGSVAFTFAIQTFSFFLDLLLPGGVIILMADHRIQAKLFKHI